MSDAVNVMMIGFPASGKTSYMASLYHRFSSETVAGFNIQCTCSHNHENLVRLGKNIQSGVYPGSTDFLSKYSFYLRYEGKTVLPFNWHDYRGGALISSYEVAKEVLDEINQADALIVFLDATSFVGSASRKAVKTVKRVYQLIQFAVQNKPQDIRFPISIAITKADAVDLSQLVESEPMKMITSQIIPTVSQSKSVCGLFTFTVVGPTCAYIEYPFIFSMWLCLQNKFIEYTKIANQCAEEYQGCLRDANEHWKKSGLIDSFMSFMVDEPSHRELAIRKQESAFNNLKHATDILDELKKIEGPLDILAKIVSAGNEDEDSLVALF